MGFNMVAEREVLGLDLLHSSCKDVDFIIFSLLVSPELDHIIKSNLTIIVCKVFFYFIHVKYLLVLQQYV